ncbi:MAG: RDD family protein [Woeseiaceae bacterium]|nr:RDD family protein [Woeseiaceae bacterium]
MLRRIGAMIYDALLVFAFLVMLAILSTAYLGGESVYAGGPMYVRGYNVVRFLIIFLFFVLYWTRRGRTLGMQSWGLQLQTADDRLPSLSQATIRFFAALLSWLPLGLGFLWQLWDRDRLTWHDRISGTRIVHYPKPPKSPKKKKDAKT